MYQFLQIACLYTVYYIYVLECLLFFFVCNINHCNNSAPCWVLDWTIKCYLISSYIYNIYIHIKKLSYTHYNLYLTFTNNTDTAWLSPPWPMHKDKYQLSKCSGHQRAGAKRTFDQADHTSIVHISNNKKKTPQKPLNLVSFIYIYIMSTRIYIYVYKWYPPRDQCT